jgi:cell division protein FtsL
LKKVILVKKIKSQRILVRASLPSSWIRLMIFQNTYGSATRITLAMIEKLNIKKKSFLSGA